MLSPLVFGLLLSSPAHAGKAERIDKLIAASVEAFRAGDYAASLAKLDRAIALNPGSQELHWARISLLGRYSQVADPSMSGDIAAAMLAECALTASLDPSSSLGQLAAGLATSLTRGSLFPTPSADCSDEAVARFNVAEALFGRGDMAGARRAYDDALALCPEHPVWWTYSGDAALEVGAVSDALADYDKALSLAPCYWVAHRFAADVILRAGGELSRVYDHLVSATACNPTYDLAWNDLQTLVGDRWRRSLAEPPAEPGVISIEASTGGEAAALALVQAAPWARWDQAMKSNKGSALERQRAAVRAGLPLVVQLLEVQPDLDLGVWSLWHEAEAAGLLDAAIFLASTDNELLGEYLDWREAHPGESEAWIRRTLAPFPAKSP